MFSAIFEVLPNKENWDDYLDNAKMLRPEVEQVEGFVDNIRYKSLIRDGWILSLSNWRDEKSLVRWRTHIRHHEAQQKGRDEIFADYHLRVGQITADNRIPEGYALTEQRLDETASRGGNDGHADQRNAPRGVEADHQPVRLRRVARPESVGGRQHVLGHLRRRTHARRPDSAHILEERRCSAGLRGHIRAE
ncbi:heme-degrading monooxygenase HmoA [Bradyrhizobium sp. LM6.11]